MRFSNRLRWLVWLATALAVAVSARSFAQEAPAKDDERTAAEKRLNAVDADAETKPTDESAKGEGRRDEEAERQAERELNRVERDAKRDEAEERGGKGDRVEPHQDRKGRDIDSEERRERSSRRNDRELRQAEREFERGGDRRGDFSDDKAERIRSQDGDIRNCTEGGGGNH